ncbi:MazG-like family protein [Kitasatospora aureofaciens]|uniref:MazG-like family protein n=1 Tax=Kitasatospora aureofaciens TaxID=1894 RepID=UPI0037C7C2DF
MVDDIHHHISAHRAGLGLSLLHLQVEEAGEVAEALLGVLGANPRKDVSHIVADLQGELCDVITAAMVALRDTTADPGAVLAEHLARWQPSRLDPEGVAAGSRLFRRAGSTAVVLADRHPWREEIRRSEPPDRHMCGGCAAGEDDGHRGPAGGAREGALP